MCLAALQTQPTTYLQKKIDINTHSATEKKIVWDPMSLANELRNCQKSCIHSSLFSPVCPVTASQISWCALHVYNSLSVAPLNLQHSCSAVNWKLALPVLVGNNKSKLKEGRTHLIPSVPQPVKRSSDFLDSNNRWLKWNKTASIWYVCRTIIAAATTCWVISCIRLIVAMGKNEEATVRTR